MSKWNQYTLKEVAEIKIGGTPQRKNECYWDTEKVTENYWVSISDLKGKFISDTKERISDEGVANSNVKLLNKNTVIMSFKLSIGKVALLSKPMYTNEAIAGFELKGNIVDKDFLYYMLNNIDYMQYVDTAVKGATLNKAKLENIIIECPSIKEQQKIAEILSSVDAAIEKTEQVIAKVEEVKKGLMQQLLTKGIGHTEFKQTEVGLIPSSWRVEKLKSVSQNIFVGIATSTTDYFCNRNQGVPLLRNQNIKENYLDLTDLVYITNDFSEKNRNKKLQKNDVIIVRTGYPGVASVVHDDLEGAQTFTTLVVRPCQEYIYSKYLSYYINSEKGKKFVLGGQAGGAQQNLNVSVLEKMPIPIPSISEQISIVHKLDNIDNVKNKNYKKLDLLNKLKQGLMQQLLTGQVRVKMD